jgi:hypothetical protein
MNLCCWTRKWSRAFVRIVVDAQPFVCGTRHHACPSEKGVVNRVGGDVCVSFTEGDIDHYQIVDVIQMISDLIRREFTANASDYQVACCAAGDLVGNMTRHVELTVRPAELELFEISSDTLEHFA